MIIVRIRIINLGLSLGFEFCVFVASWRHALRIVLPFISIIILYYCVLPPHIILGGRY